MTDTISVDAHLHRVLSDLHPLQALELTLLDAHGCVLAEDIVAPAAVPPVDCAAVDGYAVRSADIQGAAPGHPVTLPVVGEVGDGADAIYTVQPGLSVRVGAGIALPVGADVVVPVSWTDADRVNVRIDRAPDAGGYVRPAGADVVAGSTVLTEGSHLGAAQLAVLAAVGRSRAVVRPRPRVVVLSAGPDLVEPEMVAGTTRVPDVNSFALTAACREAGAIAYRVGIVSDEPAQLIATIEDQLVRADVVVVTGRGAGRSALQEVLGRLGSVQFDSVAMQPGAPQGFGVIGPDRTPIFCVSGHPVSAFVSFEVFIRPALRRLLGVEQVHRATVRAGLTRALASPPGIRQYVRGRLEVREGHYVVAPVEGVGSAHVLGLAAANCLVVVPEDATDLAVGDAVTVHVLERRHG